MFRYHKIIKKNKKLYYLQFILMLINVLYMIFPQVYVAKLMNSTYNKNLNAFYKYSIYVLIIYLTYYLYTILCNYLEKHILEKILLEIKEKIVDISINQNAKNINNDSKYLTWLINDIPIIRSNYFYSISEQIKNILLIVLGLSFFLYINIYVFLLILLLILITLDFPNPFLEKQNKSNIEFLKENEEYNSNLTNYLKSIKTLITNNKREILPELVENAYDKKYTKKIKKIKYEVLNGFIANTISKISLMSLFILFTFLINKKQLQIGDIAYITIFFHIVNALQSYFVNNIDLRSSISVLDKYSDEKIEDNDNKIKIDKIENIEYRNITINNLFDNLNIDFKINKKYLIIGESGSGKTTLVNLLLGIRDDYNGEILINNTNLKNIDLSSIYNKISFVSANSYIFNTTLENNITLYEEANVDDLIEKLNLNDIDKNIQLDENCLSTGQKQRINFLRAIFENKDIIILDEISSNLDKINQKIIEDILFNFKDKMIILISHHTNEDNFNKFDKVIKFNLV